MDVFSTDIPSPTINIIYDGLTNIGHTRSGSAFGSEEIDPMSNIALFAVEITPIWNSDDRYFGKKLRGNCNEYFEYRWLVMIGLLMLKGNIYALTITTDLMGLKQYQHTLCASPTIVTNDYGNLLN